MHDEFTSTFFTAADGVPDGGGAFGKGFAITWQRGPLVIDGERQPQNGAFITSVVAAVIDRLESHQTTKFACDANAAAIGHLGAALDALQRRTAKRKAEGLEGTNVPSPQPRAWKERDYAYLAHHPSLGGKEPILVRLVSDPVGGLVDVEAQRGDWPPWFVDFYGCVFGGYWAPVERLYATREEAEAQYQ